MAKLHFGTFLAAVTVMVVLVQGFMLHSPLYMMVFKCLASGWLMLWLGGMVQQRFDAAWLQWQVEQRLAKTQPPEEALGEEDMLESFGGNETTQTPSASTAMPFGNSTTPSEDVNRTLQATSQPPLS